MKDYKRLTERRGNLVIDNCCNCPNVNNKQGCTDKICHEIKKNRLADLEDKIDSGELCDREEVRKETAREIADWLDSSSSLFVWDEENVSQKIRKRYGVNLEEQQ